MKTKLMLALAAFALVTVVTAPAWATPGTILKYSQRLGHLIPNAPTDGTWHGENIASDVDWNLVMQPQSPTAPPLPPNWIIAEDFVDPFDTGVYTVRWWGSYIGPTFGDVDGDGVVDPIFGPGSEDGYVISFFSDRKAVVQADGTVIPSQPEELLATYVANFEDVEVKSTPLVGTDMRSGITESTCKTPTSSTSISTSPGPMVSRLPTRKASTRTLMKCIGSPSTPR